MPSKYALEKITPNANLPQELEHRRPPLGRNFAGRNGQPLALPRRVPNAGGGRVAEVQLGELGVVQDAGDEAACGGDRGIVVLLGCGVRRMERDSARLQLRTMSSRCKVLFSSNASAIATRPSAPMLLLYCKKNKIMIENKTFMRHRKKFATHKEERLHAAVGQQSVCDAASPVGADVVCALQKNCGSVERRK